MSGHCFFCSETRFAKTPVVCQEKRKRAGALEIKNPKNPLMAPRTRCPQRARWHPGQFAGNEAIAHRCQRRQKLQSQRRPDRKGRPVSPNRPLPTEHPYFSSDPRSARSSLANASWLRTSPRLPLRIFGLVASSVMIRPPTVGTFLTMRTVPMRYRTVAPAGPVG